MSRKRGLSPEEIAALLRELSDNESEGGELSELDEGSDDEHFVPPASSSSESDEDNAIDNSHNHEVFTGRDGSQWKEYISVKSSGRYASQNILRENSGPTSYAKRNVNGESVLSAWLLFIDKTILEHIIKCTKTEAHRVLESDDWSFSREELFAYISILYARGVSGARNLELHSLWSTSWGFNFCKETMSRDRFCEISRFLRFDIKSTRPTRIKQNKFALISEVWNRFIENCISCYKPGQNITIDEQLFPSKTRCPFTQFIASKPDKYGQKFWIAVDLETKYILNAFPYLGKNEERDRNQRLSEYVVLKLIEPFQNMGRNVTVDNFFTSLELAKKLKDKRTSLVGTMNKARREIPDCIKSGKEELYSTKLLKNEESGSTLTVYQCKKKKNVIILSSMHSSIDIANNSKKTPETVNFYNETKCGVDIVDKMARQYSVKAGSRRWPVHTFYNILDFAAINAWIIFKCVTGNNLSRRTFIQSLAEELQAEYIACKKSNKRQGKNEDELQSKNPPKRKKCEVKKCHGNVTNKICCSCNRMVCGKCTKHVSYKCIYCI